MGPTTITLTLKNKRKAGVELRDSRNEKDLAHQCWFADGKSHMRKKTGSFEKQSGLQLVPHFYSLTEMNSETI